MGKRIEYYSRIANQNFCVHVVDADGKVQNEANPITGAPKVSNGRLMPLNLDCKFAVVDGIPTKKGALSVFQVIVDPEEPYHKKLLAECGEEWTVSVGLLIGTAKGAEHAQFKKISDTLDALANPNSGSSIMTEEAYRKSENPEAYAKAIESSVKDAEIAKLRHELAELKAGKGGSSKHVDAQQERLRELERKNK